MIVHTWHWLILSMIAGIVIGIIACWLDDEPSSGWWDPGPIGGCLIAALSFFISIIFGLVLWLAGATLYIGAPH